MMAVWHGIKSLTDEKGLHHAFKLLHAYLSIFVLIKKGYQSCVVFLVKLLT